MKNILAYVESINGNIKRSAFEVATTAAKLKSKTNSLAIAAIINGTEEIANQLFDYGINQVINIESDILKKYSAQGIAKAVYQLAINKDCDILLFPASSDGLELAPIIASKFDAGYIADIIEMNIENDDIIVKKPVYAGKSIITTKINTPIKVFSLRPNVFTSVRQNSTSKQFESFNPELTINDCKTVVIDTVKNEGRLDVKEADIIVSGGRGMKEPENFILIEELAKVLNAAVGASRAAVDAGWRPHSEQVGQTGKTVSPSLYVACGISGAIQHLAGMSSSKVIFAINKDKEAPIFKVADYGIVGDALEVLPKLTEEIKKIKEV
ncbi:MAG TPA: electron transfer flavoprotein subunit alpha/FixB family protein [Candidatus Kapabacteria bacterium]|jgi:electron transfer flavoprotein alpha subunit|nr:electron transfer flavoprotein subunit alpha/FixB family protein [Candidatus Kapabacteria bacterium]